jgi:hypothetical protein
VAEDTSGSVIAPAGSLSAFDPPQRSKSSINRLKSRANCAIKVSLRETQRDQSVGFTLYILRSRLRPSWLEPNANGAKT